MQVEDFSSGRSVSLARGDLPFMLSGAQLVSPAGDIEAVVVAPLFTRVPPMAVTTTPFNIDALMAKLSPKTSYAVSSEGAETLTLHKPILLCQCSYGAIASLCH